MILLAKSETRTIQGQHVLVNSVCQPANLRQNDFASSITFGEHQVVAQLIVTRVLISPLIHKDSPVCHPLLARGNFASVNLNHQK
jgi:hypothetical protein